MKYITIHDYSDSRKAVKDCLKLLLSVHKFFSTEVNFEKKDKKHAAYLLVGSGIDAAYLAFDFYLKKYSASLFHLHRYLIELRALVEYFSVDDSEVESWFKGKFISGRLTKKETKENRKLKKVIPRKATIPFHFPEIENLMKVEESIQREFSSLSRFCHPTIDAINLGFSPTDKTLQYKAGLKNYYFGKDFLPILITMIIDVGRKVFSKTAKTNEVDFTRLTEFRVLFYEKSF